MDLQEHRWHKIEESSKMRGTDCPPKTRMVRRRYEPDRLSPTRLADAYEKIVPRYIRVLGEKWNEVKAEEFHQQQVMGG
jgi:hypothetical protein